MTTGTLAPDHSCRNSGASRRRGGDRNSPARWPIAQPSRRTNRHPTCRPTAFLWCGLDRVPGILGTAPGISEDQSRSICSFAWCPATASRCLPFRPGQFLNLQVWCRRNPPKTNPRILCAVIRRPIPRGLTATGVDQRVLARLITRTRPAFSGISTITCRWVIADDQATLGTLPPHRGRATAHRVDRRRHRHHPDAEHPEQRAGARCRAKVWLYYGVRNGSEHIMKVAGACRTARQSSPACSLSSAPGEDEVEGVDYDHHGRVDLPLLRNTLRLARYQFYVCGPKPMMESPCQGWKNGVSIVAGYPYESFGPATPDDQTRKPTSAATDTQPVNITFSRSETPQLESRGFASGVCRGQWASMWTLAAAPAAAVRARQCWRPTGRIAARRRHRAGALACCVLPRPVAISY